MVEYRGVWDGVGIVGMGLRFSFVGDGCEEVIRGDILKFELVLRVFDFLVWYLIGCLVYYL